MADARRAPLKDQTDISGARVLIVEARFYDDIQDALLEGAVTEIKAALSAALDDNPSAKLADFIGVDAAAMTAEDWPA